MAVDSEGIAETHLTEEVAPEATWENIERDGNRIQGELSWDIQQVLEEHYSDR